MSAGDNSGSYAPRSPDLSSFLAPGPTHSHYQRQTTQATSAPQASTSAPPPPFSLDNSQSYQAHQDLHQQPHNLYQPYNHPYQPAPAGLPYDYASYHAPVKPEYETYGAPNQAPYLPTPPAHHGIATTSYYNHHSHHASSHQLPRSLYDQPPTALYPVAPQHVDQPTRHPTSSAADHAYHHPLATAPVVKQEAAETKHHSAMPPKRAAAAAAAAAMMAGSTTPEEEEQHQYQQPQPQQLQQLQQQHSPSPMMEPSPVKTKFPTARIKRIMQADEEVGKVAQQTPIAVGKALELFMVQLVSKSADIAKDKGSKRVTASMLKQVVETDEQWDFLREIVGKVENERENGKQKKQESESEEEETFEPKKKARGRKKKVT